VSKTVIHEGTDSEEMDEGGRHREVC